jgi:SAM-dependent methyltransferase
VSATRPAGTTTSPPEAWLDALARLYDLDLEEDPGDVDLYLALANRNGDPVLEVAVGSGRIAVPLAQAGHHVTGIDLDRGMLRRATARAEAAGPDVAGRIRLVEADARHVRLPDAGSFRFAFIPFNSLLVFGDRRDQARAVATLAAHLAPDGLAVIDLWQPDADQLSRYDGRFGLEYVRRDGTTGRVVTKTASARHDASGRVELTTIYEESEQGGPVVRWVRQDRLRLVGPEELVALAESAGLRVELLAGDYDLREYEPGDERAILLASPGAGAIRTARNRARNAAGTGARPPVGQAVE